MRSALSRRSSASLSFSLRLLQVRLVGIALRIVLLSCFHKRCGVPDLGFSVGFRRLGGFHSRFIALRPLKSPLGAFQAVLLRVKLYLRFPKLDGGGPHVFRLGDDIEARLTGGRRRLRCLLGRARLHRRGEVVRIEKFLSSRIRSGRGFLGLGGYFFHGAVFGGRGERIMQNAF